MTAVSGAFAMEFLSTLPARGATSPRCWRRHASKNFYPRSPRGERQPLPCCSGMLSMISIHAPREGSDRRPQPTLKPPCNFYPRSPRGERRTTKPRKEAPHDFYPRSPRGERLVGPYVLWHDCIIISIHAPREGSDGRFAGWLASPWHFYPRSPRGERQAHRGIPRYDLLHFYPRSPRGERRSTLQRTSASWTFLSTLPARGATPPPSAAMPAAFISIHAPREGSDGGHLFPGNCLILFLSTLPARGATVDGDELALVQDVISIHAPREGSDPPRPT